MNIEGIYLDVGKRFGARRVSIWRSIALPGALPMIFAGIRLGWGVGLLLIVAAEFVGAQLGIGFLIPDEAEKRLVPWEPATAA